MIFLKNTRAESFITMIVAMFLIFTLIATFITMFPVFVTKTKVDTIAAQLTRAIELTGGAGSEYSAELADLKASTGLDPTVTISPSKTQYQLREQFTVTVSVSAKVNIFTPAAGEPLTIDIPISKTVTGRSEVFFKP
ncbi:MAG TPA: DUF4320 family protein [Clostridia bacterium]|nr:DUF4320 family protein [Clostridia bacterium]